MLEVLYPTMRRAYVTTTTSHSNENNIRISSLRTSTPQSRGSRTPRPADGALNHMAELLAKLFSRSEDPDVTALSQAVTAKVGITEPLAKPAMAASSPGLTSSTKDLMRARVSRLLPKVTCPSPFHSPSRTVPIAEQQDVPVI